VGHVSGEHRPLRPAVLRRAIVDATVMPGVGHSIDHHAAGHALHLRQLAFAHECALRPAPRLTII